MILYTNKAHTHTRTHNEREAENDTNSFHMYQSLILNNNHILFAIHIINNYLYTMRAGLRTHTDECFNFVFRMKFTEKSEKLDLGKVRKRNLCVRLFICD